VKTETAGYAAARAQRATEPIYFLRVSHVPDFGSATEYPFSRDFASRAIQAASVPKLECIEAVQGTQQQVTPEQGRSTIGGLALTLIDRGGEILRYFSAPPLTIQAAMTASAPGSGATLALNDVSGLPSIGTLEVGTEDTLERVRYSATNVAAGTVTVSGRGVDGTTAQAHAVGDPATNGEEIRSGQRATLYAGYAGLDEAAFMPFPKMQVVDRRLESLLSTAYLIELSDIMRSLRNDIFITATHDAPVIIGGHPLVIALLILLSTGTGTNGPYDQLAAENGLAIPAAFIDVVGFEAAIADFPSDGYCFTITGPVTGKDFLETEIFKTINAYPLVRQDGSLTVKLYTPVLT
jgi:hypothetical protein